MSQTDDTLPSAEELFDTVTPPYVGRPNREMDTIGWTYVAGLAIIFLPFLPLLALIWLTRRLFSALDPRDPAS
jgi:hypothetical protein